MSHPSGFSVTPGGAMAVIAIDNLVKTFGAVRALDGLDLRVEPGEVHGFSAPTAPGSPPRSGSCSGCCAATPARCGCSAPTPGATRCGCTGGWRTCRAT